MGKGFIENYMSNNFIIIINLQKLKVNKYTSNNNFISLFIFNNYFYFLL
jgi:hypothetical protein